MVGLIADQRRRTVWLSALLVLATLLLYLPVVHHEFISGWDDDDYVTQNPHVSTGATVANVRWAFSSFELSNWHPVTWLSHMLDCQLFGLNSGTHHYVNVVLHAVNVLLLFWLLQWATGAMWRSFFVAAIFALHPLNVETVAWVAQRKSLLSAFFSLLTVAAYGWYTKRGGWKRYLAIVCAYALALMSKPMAVSLPILLLLFDYWPLQQLEELPFPRSWTRLVIEKIPLFVMSAADCVITQRAQGAGGSVMGLTLLPVSVRLENAAIAYVAYIGKILWPARLSAFYPLALSPAPGDAVASAAILIAITVLALYFHRARWFLVGWFFFLITLVPVIGLVQVGFQGMADRYTYVPAIGLLVLIVWGVASAVQSMRSARIALPIVATVALVALGYATESYVRAWQNGVTLFAHARASWGRPDFWIEQLNGNSLLAAGRPDEAFDHYQQSCQLQFRTAYCHYGMGHILLGHGRPQDAFREYQIALAFTANPAMELQCFNESGEAKLQMRDYEAAQKAAAEALKIDPANAFALRLRDEAIHMRGGS